MALADQTGHEDPDDDDIDVPDELEDIIGNLLDALQDKACSTSIH